MTTQPVEGRFVSAPTRGFQGTADARTLDEIRLMTDPKGGLNFVPIQSVDPWGFIVPGEAATTLFFAVAMDGHRVPFGATFIVNWVVEGDPRVKTVRRPHAGPDPVVTIILDSDWFYESVGRRGSLSYEVELSDGTLLPGPGIEVYIPSLIKTDPIHLEGLAPGELIDTEKFPDGIAATVQMVVNAQPFHETTVVFRTLGIFPPGTDWVPVTAERHPLPQLADGPVKLTIGKHLYIDPHEWGYSRLRLEFEVQSVMAPWPNSGWGYVLDIGENVVLPPDL